MTATATSEKGPDPRAATACGAAMAVDTARAGDNADSRRPGPSRFAVATV
ncbi:MAG: hypothetical protein QOE62_1721 [Actinomycetota bacterium]|nr:hypothetical protein [Actinomycetota bacterium]